MDGIFFQANLEVGSLGKKPMGIVYRVLDYCRK